MLVPLHMILSLKKLIISPLEQLLEKAKFVASFKRGVQSSWPAFWELNSFLNPSYSLVVVFFFTLFFNSDLFYLTKMYAGYTVSLKQGGVSINRINKFPYCKGQNGRRRETATVGVWCVCWNGGYGEGFFLSQTSNDET